MVPAIFSYASMTTIECIMYNSERRVGCEIRGLPRKYPAMYYEKQTFIEEDSRYKTTTTTMYIGQ